LIGPLAVNREQLLSFSFAVAPNRTMSLLPPFHFWPRLSMMLGMINTSDIFSIGENASATTSATRRTPSSKPE
jgi:hypothetical protein